MRLNRKTLVRIVLLHFFLLSFVLTVQAEQRDSVRSVTKRVGSILQKLPIQLVSPLQELKWDLESIIQNSDFSNATIGLAVQSAETSEYIFSYNATKNLIPASTQKLLTTSAALKYLGKDYKYSTYFYLDGFISDDGEFNGNIIIRGTGDPTISGFFYSDPLEVLDSWALKLDLMGISSIRGNIIGDDNYFDEEFYGPGWAWDDLPYSYSAQVNALNIFDNKIDIEIEKDGKDENSYRINIIPDNSYVEIEDKIQYSATRIPDELILNRDYGSNIIEVSGIISNNTLSKHKRVLSVTIDNPTLFLLSLFRDALERKNIQFRGALLDIDDLQSKPKYSDLQPAFIHLSRPVSDIIKVINTYSHNLASDILLKTIAKEKTGTGSFSNGARLVLEFASDIGISPENIVYVDGSGLSRFNLISPKYQLALLSWIYKSGYSKLLLNSLAVSGKPGTLERRMTHSLAESNLRAKTGTMNAVSTIAGFVKTRDGESLAFSMMIMNFTVPFSVAQNLQDLVGMRLASFSRNPY